MHNSMRVGGVAILALVFAGCAGGGGRGDGGAESCMNDLECDDGFPCTIDACGVDNRCVHDPIDERCEMGQSCEVGRGCVSASSCAMDTDCDDGFPCTTDRCGVGGICNHTAVNERCSMGEICDVSMGCITPPGCDSSAECDDGIPCTNDTCGVDRTCTNTPLNELCDTAGGEICSATSGCFVPMTCSTDADCDDMNFCNGAETCGTEFACNPPTPRVCDDSDDCTIDSCDTTADMCVFACDTSRPECDCPTAPPTCDGTFNVTGASTSYTCAFGMAAVDWSRVVIANDGGVITVRLAAQHFSSPLIDNTEPVCPTFEASFLVPGGCDELWSISGTFTDADHFNGSFRASFVENDGFSCGVSGCGNQNIMISGTRM
ncbi:MAG: hypothetical protein H6719_01890 [Sandaracinaceae bacterium]|nr:hypothetical protein [Sandaracinaceae bacterium]